MGDFRLRQALLDEFEFVEGGRARCGRRPRRRPIIAGMGQVEQFRIGVHEPGQQQLMAERLSTTTLPFVSERCLGTPLPMTWRSRGGFAAASSSSRFLSWAALASSARFTIDRFGDADRGPGAGFALPGDVRAFRDASPLADAFCARDADLGATGGGIIASPMYARHQQSTGSISVYLVQVTSLDATLLVPVVLATDVDVPDQCTLDEYGGSIDVHGTLRPE